MLSHVFFCFFFFQKSATGPAEDDEWHLITADLRTDNQVLKKQQKVSSCQTWMARELVRRSTLRSMADHMGGQRLTDGCKQQMLIQSLTKSQPLSRMWDGCGKTAGVGGAELLKIVGAAKLRVLSVGLAIWWLSSYWEKKETVVLNWEGKGNIRTKIRWTAPRGA